MSDEDNCNKADLACINAPYAHASYLTDYLDSIRELGTQASVYGIFWKPDSNRCSDASFQAEVYQEAVEKSNGISALICQNNYDGTMASFAGEWRELAKN